MAKTLMKGNEALAETALRVGCRFFCGYPITPQSEIMEYLSWRMAEVGGEFVQTESELSAINMLMGAAAVGARAFTSSSGPGFSLMQEGISYIVAADLPLVVVNVMREGSGLGNIGASQGDYWQMTRGGGHGDYRTIVLAPAGVQETSNLMAESFDLAEKYRHPVLICSDAAVGQMVEPVTLPELREHDINKYDWALRGCKPGDEIRTIQNVYFLDEDYENHLRQKYADIEANEQRWESIEIADAELVLVSYGISSRFCKEAVRNARSAGFKLGLIRLITLWPFPVKAFAEVSPSTKAFLSVEMSTLGQLVDDIRLATGCAHPVDHYGSMMALPETKGIIGKAQAVLKKVSG
ncbi:MAG: 3-methyl-2-oxobutanoate dehydrogenase subunit VorB [Deltaproteobacteria bacterium]|jgi:2-oxoglutarate ferredoxin oxidoreductase subunit alpha|nr:3-methyl-2-oxobutanoate dehydrogenase subunit VorB [Deltaproteobacteria bacterium]